MSIITITEELKKLNSHIQILEKENLELKEKINMIPKYTKKCNICYFNLKECNLCYRLFCDDCEIKLTDYDEGDEHYHGGKCMICKKYVCKLCNTYCDQCDGFHCDNSHCDKCSC